MTKNVSDKWEVENLSKLLDRMNIGTSDDDACYSLLGRVLLAFETVARIKIKVDWLEPNKPVEYVHLKKGADSGKDD